MIGRRVAAAVLGAAALGIGIGIGALPGCAALLGPRTIEVPQARLQALIEKRFPVNKRVFDVIDVTLDSPRVILEPATNRIDVEVALNAGGAGNDGAVRTSMAGSLLVSQSLRFEPSDNTIRLTDVRVERFAIDGLAANWQRQLDRLGKPLAKSLLEGQVLYALQPKDIAGLEGHGVRPSDLRVTATGVSVTLVLVER